MNFLILFVLLLQVLAVLCKRCITKDGDIGYCKTRLDCHLLDGTRPLAKCGNTGKHCCPTDALNVTSTSVDSNPLSVTPTSVDSKFPTDCGDTPMYPKGHIVGGMIIAADEYSWLASLQYGNNGSYGVCGGSVINTRYVLTAAHCVTGEAIAEIGGLTGVRLGQFDQNNNICDYGTENCTLYQQFGIEKIIVHSGYVRGRFRIVHDIALLRLDRSIRFGPNMKPICLPFGPNSIPEPLEESTLIVSGWGLTMDDNDFPAKRDVSITLWATDKCKSFFRVDETHICAIEAGKNSCNGDSGCPLMIQFASRRMAIEGIVSYGIQNCKKTGFPGVYTRVRSYRDWLNENMEM